MSRHEAPMLAFAMVRRVAPCALACALLSGVAAAQEAPDPLWSGLQPNTWLYASPTSPPVPVRVGGPGARTEQVTNTSPGFFEVLFSGGGAAQVTGASPSAILVNRVAGSAPVPALGPAVVVTGYGPAAFTEIGGALQGPGGVAPTPYVRFRPASGSYSRSSPIGFETMSLEPVDQVRVRVLHQGAWMQTVEAPSGVLAPLPQGASDVHWSVAIGAAVYSGVASYVVNVPLAIDTDADLVADALLDEDGDGVPDAAELEYGGDPTQADLGRDRDADGMSDFDEWVRGSDPTCAPPTPAWATTPCLPIDGDGDGWSDWDEAARLTDATDATCEPAAKGLLSGELIASSPVHDAGLGSDAAVAAVGGIDVVGLDWGGRDLRGAEGCELGFAPGPGTGTSRRSLPGLVLRASADAPMVMRSTGPAWDASDVQVGKAGWVGLAFIEALPEATPDRVSAALDAASLTDAESFRAAYQTAFASFATAPFGGRVGPRALLPAALLADLAAWHAELGAGLRPVLGLATLASVPDAMHAVFDRADDPSRLLGALDDLFVAGAPLAGEAAALTTLLGADDSQPVDVRLAATSLGRYLARVHLVVGSKRVQDLDAVQRASLFDATVDFDLDGLTSGAELVSRTVDAQTLAITPAAATDPTRPDSDGDLALDGADPCPNDARDDCLQRQASLRDSDGDGTIDPLDNCLNLANASQSDGDGDGLGDACSGLAYIVEPRLHPVVRTGTWLRFRSQLGKLGKDSSGLTYRWSFGGLAPDQTAAQPSDVFVTRPGTYRVELWVGATGHASQVIDFRDVTVIGPAVTLDVGIEVTGTATEGVRLTFKASASSPVGTITGIAWDMGDGTTLSGTTVRHTYAQQGSKRITATATDSRGLTGSATIELLVGDTAPVARFDGTIDRLTLSLTDTSTAYDGIASRIWNLGDGSPAQTTPTVSHTYAAAGRYTVSLTVVDTDGSAKTTTKSFIADDKKVQRLLVEIDDTWQAVDLDEPMIDPIVLPGVVNPSLAGTSGVVRVRNVGPEGFEMRFEAWPPMPLLSMAVPVDVIVVERGSHLFADGTRWQADTLPLSGSNASFVVEAFGGVPSAIAPNLLLTAVQTANDPAPVGVRTRSFSATGFEVALMQREADRALMRAEEEVGFLAIWAPLKRGSAIVDGAVASWTSAYFKLGTAPKTYGHCILALAEDTSFDAETAHVAEFVWLLRTLNGCWASVVSNIESDPVVIERR